MCKYPSPTIYLFCGDESGLFGCRECTALIRLPGSSSPSLGCQCDLRGYSGLSDRNWNPNRCRYIMVLVHHVCRIKARHRDQHGSTARCLDGAWILWVLYRLINTQPAVCTDLPAVYFIVMTYVMYVYIADDLKVLVRSFSCEGCACYGGNPRESFFEFAREMFYSWKFCESWILWFIIVVYCIHYSLLRATISCRPGFGRRMVPHHR
jgi:hypothetical protein